MPKQKNVQFKILEIKKLNHFENDFHDLKLTEEELKTVSVEISQSSTADSENNILTLNVECSFVLQKDKSIKLFGIKTAFKFLIKDMSQYFTFKEDSTFEMPIALARLLFSLSLSTIRGMLAVLTLNPLYQKIILPEINPALLIKSKEEIEKEEEASIQAV
jgi:hypothetical protein